MGYKPLPVVGDALLDCPPMDVLELKEPLYHILRNSRIGSSDNRVALSINFTATDWYFNKTLTNANKCIK